MNKRKEERFFCTASGVYLFDHLLRSIFQSSITHYHYNFTVRTAQLVARQTGTQKIRGSNLAISN